MFILFMTYKVAPGEPKPHSSVEVAVSRSHVTKVTPSPDYPELSYLHIAGEYRDGHTVLVAGTVKEVVARLAGA